MGMEVGVATELVAGQGGRKKERGGGGHKTNRDTETTYSKEKGPHCLRVRVCVCNPRAIMCNGQRRKCARASAD